jgi:KipI family sensor histidine kinase inhibitor
MLLMEPGCMPQQKAQAQTPPPQFLAASDQSLLVTLGSEISLPVHRSVVQLLHALQDARIPGVVNLHPAYCSILIRFNSLVTGHESLAARVREMLLSGSVAERQEPPVVEIPVRYGGEFGPDLAEVGEISGLSPQQVIELHASTSYTVYFLGFVPGFAYMGRLPASIRVPRLEKPRKQVPAGSVAIANDHTAVYPISTPGGWRLIGRTELMLFDPARANLSVLNMGDQVRFCPVRL